MPNAHFYEYSLKLWEGLSQRAELQRHVQRSAACSTSCIRRAEMDAALRRGNAMRLNGIDAEVADRATKSRRGCRYLDCSPNARFPIDRRIAAAARRHRAPRRGRVGLCAGAPIRCGVDIIQKCEVTGIRTRAASAVTGVETTRGVIGAGKIGIAVAGHSSQVAAMAGIQAADRDRMCCRRWSPSRSSRCSTPS